MQPSEGGETADDRVLTSADYGIPPQSNHAADKSERAPTVFLQALRPHTYHGRPQTEGDVYLAHEHEVENIENLKFAVRIPPPPRAIRPPDAIAVTLPGEARPELRSLQPGVVDVVEQALERMGDAFAGRKDVMNRLADVAAITTEPDPEPLIVPPRRRRRQTT